jgi:hypothetical protein
VTAWQAAKDVYTAYYSTSPSVCEIGCATFMKNPVRKRLLECYEKMCAIDGAIVFTDADPDAVDAHTELTEDTDTDTDAKAEHAEHAARSTKQREKRVSIRMADSIAAAAELPASQRVEAENEGMCVCV